MQPNRIGRILGVGARVARVRLTQSIDRLGAPQPGAGAAAPARPAPAAPNPAPRPAAARIDTAQLADHSRRLARGAGRFGAALLRPFAHAGGILWNQIAGLFFALFAIFFIEHSWILYRSFRYRDHHLFLYAPLAVLFVWFAVSSFWRAHSRQKAR